MLGFKGIHTHYGTNAFVTEGGLQFLSKYTLNLLCDLILKDESTSLKKYMSIVHL